uniref:Glycosyltransferase n=1 Tax=Erysipelothrix tonsillarum TaxID=38402 RepID=A0A6S6I5A3_9FIRM|nr:glycosyltransferase [Erysipelothrix tonsillarum]
MIKVNIMKKRSSKEIILFSIVFIYVFQIINREFRPLIDLRYINTFLMLIVLLKSRKKIRTIFENYSGVVFFAFNCWAISSLLFLFLGSNYSLQGRGITINVLVLYIYNILFVLVLYLNKEFITFKKVYTILCISYVINFFASISLIYIIEVTEIDLQNFIMPFSNIRGFIFGKEHYNFLGGNYRIAGYSEDANYLAINSIIMLVLSLRNYNIKKFNEEKIISIVMILCSIILILLSASKTILLGSIISLGLLYINKKYKKKLTLKLIIGIIGVSIIVAFNKSLFTLGPSMTNRLYLWDRSLELFKNHPLVGGGLTSIRHLGFDQGWVVHSHSTYIQVVSELGLVGLMLFVSLISTQLNSIKDNYYIYLSYIFIIAASTLDLSYTNYMVFFIFIIPLIDRSQRRGEEPMVIFQLSNGLSNGGAERVAYDLSKGLSESDTDKTVYLILTDPSDEGNKLEHQFEIDGIDFKIINLSTKKHDFIFNNFRVLKLISSLNPDIIHTHQITLIYCLLGYMFGGINSKIHTVHNDSHQEFGSRLFRQIYHVFFIVFRINLVSISEYILKTSLEEYRYLCQTKHYMIYNGRTIELPDKRNKRKSFSIVMVGRLTSVKNHIAAVRTMDIIVNHYNRTDFILNIYGEGPLKEELLHEIKKLKVDKYVNLCGISNDIPNVLMNNDLFLMTSIHEGFPISAIEAITAGLPLILSEFGSAFELVNGNGAIVSTNNYKDVADKIIEMKDSISLYELSSKTSKQKSEKFTLKSMIDNYSILFNNKIEEEL